MKRDNQIKFERLREQYEAFIFNGFDIIKNDSSIKIVFDFRIDDKFVFNPFIEIPNNRFKINNPGSGVLETLAFNLGMIELVSYWKATCAGKVIIKPATLDEKAINHWKKLYFNGLGEFFFTNNITTNINTFMELIPSGKVSYNRISVPFSEKVLVPVGGGKDSAVTLELLKDDFEVIPFILNPRKATVDSIVKAGFPKDGFFRINRTLDPLLLELNAKGFLNGHTPFSALLAYTTLFASVLSGAAHIALSNEASANEPTDFFTGVNHQYSKSIEFEQDFRNYVSRYISSEINYFSFLRPLSELQIAALFSSFRHYHKVFRSCNAGSKANLWCGECSKCLFTAIILSPFLKRKEIIEIFNKDILNDVSLKPVLDELTGVADIKPFECVGTVNEVNYAINMAIDKWEEDLPELLQLYRNELGFSHVSGEMLKFPDNFNNKHFLNNDFLNVLVTKVEQIYQSMGI